MNMTDESESRPEFCLKPEPLTSYVHARCSGLMHGSKSAYPCTLVRFFPGGTISSFSPIQLATVCWSMAVAGQTQHPAFTSAWHQLLLQHDKVATAGDVILTQVWQVRLLMHASSCNAVPEHIKSIGILSYIPCDMKESKRSHSSCT